jgi:hypothetical protein
LDGAVGIEALFQFVVFQLVSKYQVGNLNIGQFLDIVERRLSVTFLGSLEGSRIGTDRSRTGWCVQSLLGALLAAEYLNNG